MPGILSIRSNVKQFLKKNFPSPADRAKRFAAAMKKIGRMYISRVQRKYLSGRPGLNRRTGHLARTWYHTVLSPNRLDRMKLVIWTPTPYAQYHADVYKPKHEPRRFPPRLLVGAEWNAVTQRDGMADVLLTEAFLPPTGSGLHYGMVDKMTTFLRRDSKGRFISFKGSKRAAGNAWVIKRGSDGRFQSVRRVR